MKSKIVIRITLAILLVAIVAFSGCIEEQSLPKETHIIAPELPEQPIMTSVQPTIPITQNINGNYKVQDVSGDTININGNYNKIRILNADASLIRVNGNYNTVYYPKEARPVIKENGNGNEIKTY
ncbi:MAG: hypothetical protein LAKADJCE_00666 [Candidatus Argoarchaeum ethanivorans]|uniref:DUF3060 domain-containing protein n=1 Tax=Candidatus Argoarchaeum ethanivorans TaxID=2608793 RepID=A0A811TEU0_9EURY|nr:MAG: hypothetical protein LAKADJCE_00666 [Candidatus Argoarchaeum ethanivorans]